MQSTQTMRPTELHGGALTEEDEEADERHFASALEDLPIHKVDLVRVGERADERRHLRLEELGLKREAFPRAICRVGRESLVHPDLYQRSSKGRLSKGSQ